MRSPEKVRGHILFDCDDTLIASRAQVLQVIQNIVSEVRGYEVSLLEISEAYTPDIYLLASRLGIDVKDHKKVERVRELWGHAMSEHGGHYQVFSGIRELLDKLEGSFGLYIWTGRDRQSLQLLLRSTGLEKYFWDLACVDDAFPKPNALGAREILGDVPAEKTVMIGDTMTDMQAAKNLNCLAIGALWSGLVKPHVLGDAGADYVVESPADCLQIILERFPAVE